MNFKTTVMPGVRAFASTMRVKLFRERLLTTQVNTPFGAHSSSASAHPRANWRVCPMTGRLQQRWSLDDSQEPPSRCLAYRFQQASLMLGLYTEAHTLT
ncbi:MULTISPECIES: hypothetical protein [unclassified Pseudomonas]|uniref:hypothetical protein n=1 Tax=unclassified Pseudomonas TaxID=196821 RepID=UPI002AC94AAE|nr:MULTISPECIES: hypothetical protein [unclassified Pseudomonas]MEB0045667.1 hypothetical protein [Pseudomonas sp. Dout3]MEB0095550.1 hypothetical protein [Pseudomonas sp. DC1.2]WPX61131.1 hypothetical protein RHM68_10995 [Pseudomonas sp. DC1.2]